MSHIKIEKLNSSVHNRDHFDCGEEILNIFLKQRANQEQKKRLNVTYVAVEGKSREAILGYYTLSNSSLALYMLQPEFKKHVPPTYTIPSVKIGRLAVDQKHQHKGIGRLLLQDAFYKIIDAAEISGIRGIEVIAKTEKAKIFYQKYGFVLLEDAQNQLFLPIETIFAAQ